MKRLLCACVWLLWACVALAAPAPVPFMPGWSRPVDPDKDCKVTGDRDSFTIEMPGGDHDYELRRQRFNAPRILRDFEGDFEIQMRVKIDGSPSRQSAANDQPSYVSAGFLVMFPRPFAWECRWDYRVGGQGAEADGCAAQRVWLGKRGEGGMFDDLDRTSPKWPFKAKPEYVYLRLEQWGGMLAYYVSPDGKQWVNAGGTGSFALMTAPTQFKVGLVACSTSADSCKVRFDQIKITYKKKRDPWDFVAGWGDPVDPDKDCKIKRSKDALDIEMPGSDHEYDPDRKQLNAPRLMSKLEGSFDLEVRVRIDYRSSARSTIRGQPPYVSAGFLLVCPDNNCWACTRLEYAVAPPGSKPVNNPIANAPAKCSPRRQNPAPQDMEADNYAVMQRWFREKDGGVQWFGNGFLWERGWQDWPLPDKTDCAYLRLQGRDRDYCFYLSPDGDKWIPLTAQRLSAGTKVGLAAHTASSEPSRVRFDRIKLTQGKKKAE